MRTKVYRDRWGEGNAWECSKLHESNCTEAFRMPDKTKQIDAKF